MANIKYEAQNTKQHQNANVRNCNVYDLGFGNCLEFRIYNNLGFKS